LCSASAWSGCSEPSARPAPTTTSTAPPGRRRSARSRPTPGARRPSRGRRSGPTVPRQARKVLARTPPDGATRVGVNRAGTIRVAENRGAAGRAASGSPGETRAVRPRGGPGEATSPTHARPHLRAGEPVPASRIPVGPAGSRRGGRAARGATRVSDPRPKSPTANKAPPVVTDRGCFSRWDQRTLLGFFGLSLRSLRSSGGNANAIFSLAVVTSSTSPQPRSER
jgi:hypothetical protein